jgi:hypothetical protein
MRFLVWELCCGDDDECAAGCVGGASEEKIMWRLVGGGKMGTTVAATSLAKDYDLPWVEKYRPHRVADIVGNQDVVARLQVIAQGGNMPNLIFSVSEICFGGFWILGVF